MYLCLFGNNRATIAMNLAVLRGWQFILGRPCLMILLSRLAIEVVGFRNINMYFDYRYLFIYIYLHIFFFKWKGM